MDSAPSVSARKCAILAIVCGLICFAAISIAYAAFIHYYYGGLPHASFLVSSRWGTTKFEKDAGWEPVFHEPNSGWDGQFYFRQSTDPFMQTDSVQCSDNVSYRYQRNGVPLVAWMIARTIGMYPTNGWVFQEAQFALIGTGFGVLLYWLLINQIPWSHCVAWLFCGGFFSLFHGLPDTGADAVFIISCFCLLKQRLIGYAISTTLLLLCREGYVAYAAPVFLLSILNRLAWMENGRWKVAMLTALPGVVVVAWSIYVAVMTGTRPLSGAGQLPFGHLVDWPFHAYFRAMVIQYPTSQGRELILRTVCALTILLVMTSLVVRIRTWNYALAFLPYVILISMTGYTIWENETGYPKATSGILIIALFSMPLRYRYLFDVILVAHLFLGMQMAHHFNIKYQGYLHPAILSAQTTLQEEVGPSKAIAADALPNEPATVMNYELSLRRLQAKSPTYKGLFESVHRYPLLLEATIVNRSDKIWLAQNAGTTASYAIAIQILSSGKLVHFQTVNLDRDLAPGETTKLLIGLPLKKDDEQNQIIVGLFQAPGLFFLEEQGGSPYRGIIQDVPTR